MANKPLPTRMFVRRCRPPLGLVGEKKDRENPGTLVGLLALLLYSIRRHGTQAHVRPPPATTNSITIIIIDCAAAVCAEQIQAGLETGIYFQATRSVLLSC